MDFQDFLNKTVDSVKAGRKRVTTCTYDKDRAYRLTLSGRVFQRRPMYFKNGPRCKGDRAKIFKSLKEALSTDKHQMGLLEYGYYNQNNEKEWHCTVLKLERGGISALDCNGWKYNGIPFSEPYASFDEDEFPMPRNTSMIPSEYKNGDIPYFSNIKLILLLFYILEKRKFKKNNTYIIDFLNLLLD